MRKFLTVVIIGLISLFTMVAGGINENPALQYIGITIGLLLGLAIVIWLFRTIAKFIGKQLTSYFTVLLASIIIFVLAWHGVISGLFGVLSGVILGVLHLWFFVRWLGNKSQKSLLLGEVFSYVTNYQISGFIKETVKEITLETKEDLYDEAHDRKNIVAILKELGYKTKEAKEAANYAIENTNHNTIFDDKVVLAIKYFGSGVKS